MARQTSFGDALRNARERKGLDLSTAARKLRIRPDILRAIEDGDFARMPPRGYTSNMVGAYARLVGLNPSEITRAYRDEAYQFETGRRPFDRGDRPRSSDHYGDRGSSRGAGAQGRSSRRTETLEMPSNRSPRGRSSYGTGRSGRGVAAQPQYTNLVQGRQAPGITSNFGSYLPLIIVGAIILILLILVITLAFGNKGGQTEDTPTIPISGMANPSGTDNGSGDNAAQAPSVEPVAPTSAKFAYKVLDGKEAYIEIYVDGDANPAMAKEVTGPSEGDYDVTGTLRFVTTSPDNVEVTLDGEKLELTDPNSKGVYSCTVDFDEVLDQWRKDNGVSAKDDSSKNDDSSDTGDSAKDDSSQKSDSGDSADSSGTDQQSAGSDDSGSSDSGDSSDSTN